MKIPFLQVEDKVKYMGEYTSIKGKNQSLIFYSKLVTNYDKTFPSLLKHKVNKGRIFTSELKGTYDFFISIVLLYMILPCPYKILIHSKHLNLNFFNVLAKYFVNATGPPQRSIHKGWTPFPGKIYFSIIL